MSDGLRAAASGMAAQQAWLDALANDVANVNTDGYHAVRVGFRELVDGAGAAEVDLGRSSAPGSPQPSDDPLAVALDGPGYIEVKLPNGQTGLTRNGQLRVDARGHVVDGSGHELVPPLVLPKSLALSDLGIAADGTVSAQGKKLGRISIVDVANPDGLVPAGDGVFTATAASGAPSPTTTRLQQGAVESSDVDVAGTMASMIEAQRAYDLSSRALKMQDDLRQIANDLRH